MDTVPDAGRKTYVYISGNLSDLRGCGHVTYFSHERHLEQVFHPPKPANARGRFVRDKIKFPALDKLRDGSHALDLSTGPGDWYHDFTFALINCPPGAPPSEIVPQILLANRSRFHASMTIQLGAQAPESDRASSLMGLPLDMQTYLLSFVAPLDILHLRMVRALFSFDVHPITVLNCYKQTCRAFHVVTSQQIVWIEALRQICLANAVFLPTFPLDKMSLAELEHAAMAPYKWMALSSARDGSASRTALNTHRMRFLSPLAAESLDSDEMDTAEEDDFEVRSLFLVPGGRYLVTFAWRWVCVWDIGFAPHPENDYIHRPIAMVKMDLHSTHLVHASPDGQALRIFISCPTYVNEEKL